MDNQPLPQPKVSRIGIGRLYNLGNYEHIRYDLTVEVPDGASAMAVFKSMVRLLRALNPKPPCTKYDYNDAVETLAKSADHLGNYERERVPILKKRLEEYEEWKARRSKAVSLFDQLGGSTVEMDHKDSWEDDCWED